MTITDIRTVDSVAAIGALTTDSNALVLRGHYGPGTQGGGTLVLNPGSSATPDDGLVFADPVTLTRATADFTTAS